MTGCLKHWHVTLTVNQLSTADSFSNVFHCPHLKSHNTNEKLHAKLMITTYTWTHGTASVLVCNFVHILKEDSAQRKLL